MTRQGPRTRWRDPVFFVRVLVSAAIGGMLFVIAASHLAAPAGREILWGPAGPGADDGQPGPGPVAIFLCYQLPPYVCLACIVLMAIATAHVTRKTALLVILGWIVVLALELGAFSQWLYFIDD